MDLYMKQRIRNMIKLSLLLITAFFIFACDYPKEERSPQSKVYDTKETKTQPKKIVPELVDKTQPKKIISALVDRLKNRLKISSLLSNKIIFIFHSDNRCDGSTDGIISNLSGSSIDRPFKIQVTNDGEGWACDKKKVSKYFLDFYLGKRLTQWDRIESSEYNNETNSVYIMGGGESDYMVFHFKKERENYSIYKIEYRSEDPG